MKWRFLKILLPSTFIFSLSVHATKGNVPSCEGVAKTLTGPTAKFAVKYKDAFHWTRPEKDESGSTKQSFGLRGLEGHRVAFLEEAPNGKTSVSEGLVIGADYYGNRKILEPFVVLRLKSGKTKNVLVSRIRRTAVILPEKVLIEEFERQFPGLRKIRHLPQTQSIEHKENYLGKKIAVLVKRGEHQFAVVGRVQSSLFRIKNDDFTVYHDTLAVLPDGGDIAQKYHVSEISQIRIFD